MYWRPQMGGLCVRPNMVAGDMRNISRRLESASPGGIGKRERRAGRLARDNGDRGA